MNDFSKKNFLFDKPFSRNHHLASKELMKKDILISSFVLVVCSVGMAQKQDSVAVKSLVEKGSQGDILLGNENKKNQLSGAPQILNITDSSQKKDIHSKKKKQKHKKL